MIQKVLPLLSVIIIMFFAESALAVKTIRGSIGDARTNEALAAANIQIEGTFQGTISNEDGNFIIHLDTVPATLLITYIGYQSHRIPINEETPENITIQLQPTILEMDAIVVIAEDPAMAIMRKVIKYKQEWQKQLSTYSANAYSRLIFENDSGIVSIAESLSDTFWDREKGSREVIKSKRQTSNLSETQNMAVASFIPNFYDDDIDIIGFKVIGPTHPEALDYYEFKLLKERQFDDKKVFDIRVIPNSKLQPTFEGTVAVLDEDFALLNVELKPGPAIRFPIPIQELNLFYRQQFRNFANSYWLPVDYRVGGDIKIGFTGLQFPRIKYKRVTALSNYHINIPLPDSLYQEEKILSVDSLSLQQDTLFAAAKVLIPLTVAEENAYHSLDSTMTLKKAFKPTGILADMINITTGDAEDDTTDKKNVFSYLLPELWFNRVDALHAGMTFMIDISKNANFSIGSAYKTGLKKWSYHTGLDYFFGSKKQWQGSINYQVGTDTRYHSEIYSMTVAGLSPLLGGEDYFDYYWREGISLELGYHSSPLNTKFTIGLNSDKHRSVSKTSDYNILGSDFKQRENPGINEGTLRSLYLKMQYGSDYIPFGIIGQNRISVNIETSHSSVLPSDFSFTRYTLSAGWHIDTFLKRRLLPNALDIQLSAGYSSGDLPYQRYGIIDGSLEIFTPFAAIRSRRSQPYEGEKYFAFFWEHNFRTVPFEMINFDFIVDQGIGIIIFGAHGRSWISAHRLSDLSPQPSYIDHFHHELGISLNNVFSLIRIDTSYRLDNKVFYVGLSLARFF
jgi:hypothetical protein